MRDAQKHVFFFRAKRELILIGTTPQPLEALFVKCSLQSQKILWVQLVWFLRKLVSKMVTRVFANCTRRRSA